VPITSQLDVSSFYSECSKICNLNKGTFTIKYQVEGSMNVCVSEEDMKMLFRAQDKPVKVFIHEDLPCQLHVAQSVEDSSRFEHKYDQPADVSLVDLATVTDLTTSLDSISQSTELTAVPCMDSSLAFAFALATTPPPMLTSVTSPNISQTTTSQSTTSLSSEPQPIPVPVFPTPDPASSVPVITISDIPVISTPVEPCSGIVDQLSQKICELQRLVMQHSDNQQQLMCVCSNLVSTVETLKESLSTMRQEVRNEIRDQFSGEFIKRITEEIAKEVKSVVLEQLTPSSTSASKPSATELNASPGSEETKEDDGLVRLQASVSSPEQLEALKKFESMGFTNLTFNSVLLEIHKGDEEKVLTDLKKFYQVK